jgi:hypothetical protein
MFGTSPEFSGVTLDVDPETKFLIKSNHAVRSDVGVRNELGQFVPGSSGGYDRIPVFTCEKKLRVLNLLWDLWPDISHACSLVGISRLTFNNHLAVDKSFAECVEEMQERYIDRIERRRMLMADLPAGALDRMAVLNAYRRERYNPKTEIEVKHTMTSSEALERSRVIEASVDAEVIETVKRIKAQRPRPPRP